MTSKGKLLECLRLLGVNFKLETFTERKILQKLVYLLQVFGVDMEFTYDWYLHGPYSPSLTRTLYEIIDSKTFSREELCGTEIARIDRLKSFLGNDILSSDKLELLVSIHYLRDHAGKIGASEEEVRKVIRRTKPYFSPKEVQDCWQKAIELNKLLG